MQILVSLTNEPSLFILVLPTLAIAAVMDWRTRNVPNYVWYPLLSLGAVVMFDRIMQQGPVLTSLISITIALIAWELHWIGGADAKCFIGLFLCLDPVTVWAALFFSALFMLPVLLLSKKNTNLPLLVPVFIGMLVAPFLSGALRDVITSAIANLA